MEEQEKKPRLKRALSVSDLLTKHYKTYQLSEPWADAFGEPEEKGVWFVWGGSGSGKSTFVAMLCKELARFGKVAYNSLEEGAGLTVRNTFMRVGMADVKRKVILLNERMDELSHRLSQRKSPGIVVIDSVQYAGFRTIDDYFAFKERHRDKLLVFISQAKGRRPYGRTAEGVMYDAVLKIWVEGYRAVSKGRFFGRLGYYDIWPEKAAEYWGEVSHGNQQPTNSIDYGKE